MKSPSELFHSQIVFITKRDSLFMSGTTSVTDLGLNLLSQFSFITRLIKLHLSKPSALWPSWQFLLFTSITWGTRDLLFTYSQGYVLSEVGFSAYLWTHVVEMVAPLNLLTNQPVEVVFEVHNHTGSGKRNYGNRLFLRHHLLPTQVWPSHGRKRLFKFNHQNFFLSSFFLKVSILCVFKC